MSVEDVDSKYRENWIDPARVESAREAWHAVDGKVSWESGKELMQAEVDKQGGKMGALVWGETAFDSLAIMLGFGLTIDLNSLFF